MRLGIDLGGTKTEIIVLDESGKEIYRKRVNTDSGSYEGITSTIAGLIHESETVLGQTGKIGIGIPGTISSKTGCVKNANTNALNGHPLDLDLSCILNREVRVMNDANCLALSEAVDGAGAGYRVVFAAILGTGCGAGIAIDGKPWAGPNLVAGEWGHNPLPWMKPEEYPGPECWCGQSSCIEKWISGKGFEEDYVRMTPGLNLEKCPGLTGEQVVSMARQGDSFARLTLERYADRLARSLAHIINILDPDIIVLGGGMSNVSELYEMVPKKLSSYVFGGEAETKLVRSKHGDSSGVRGAAWLWPK
ncbi:MAG: ROK family protein [Candidatus Riflebacteria bacterium]|nr:ROK family protein [Candidatus Riflebacteria bacterium]